MLQLIVFNKDAKKVYNILWIPLSKMAEFPYLKYLPENILTKEPSCIQALMSYRRTKKKQSKNARYF